MKKVSKTEAKEQIQEFFNNLGKKTPNEVKKIKKLAMSHNIKLGDKKKLFCKKCFKPYKSPSVRIKNDMIRITCENCEHKNRWKFKGDLNFGIKRKESGECC